MLNPIEANIKSKWGKINKEKNWYLWKNWGSSCSRLWKEQLMTKIFEVCEQKCTDEPKTLRNWEIHNIKMKNDISYYGTKLKGNKMHTEWSNWGESLTWKYRLWQQDGASSGCNRWKWSDWKRGWRQWDKRKGGMQAKKCVIQLHL